MSRRSLSEICEGRDPLILAENVRRRREEEGWSMSRLSRESGVSMSTLRRIDQGLGCTPLVERKVATALRTAEGRLWQKFQPRLSMLRPLSEARWHFSSWDECSRYLRRLGRVEERDPFPHDPDEIQDEAERLRLGRNGLADSFFRLTSSVLKTASTSSTVIELYNRLPGALDEGLVTYFYCLRGEVRICNGGETFELGPGDVLTFEFSKPSYIEPVNRVGPNDLPPLLIFVDCESYRRMPNPNRPNARMRI